MSVATSSARARKRATSTSGSVRSRAWARRLSPLLLVLTLLGLGAPALGALPESPVRPGSFTLTTADGSPDLTLWEAARLEAILDFPATARQGDQFTIGLPAELAPAAGLSFPIMSTTVPEVPIAQCATTGNADAGFVTTCTLTDYFDDDRGVVNGVSFWMAVQAIRTTEATTLDFAVDGGVTYEVPIPGGPGIGFPPPPGDISKSGEVERTGTIAWVIAIPGADVVGINPVVLTDTLVAAGPDSEAHTYVPGSLRITRQPVAGGAEAPANGIFTGGFDAALTSMTLTSTGPLDPDYVYRVGYATEPSGEAFVGDVFKNVADVSGTSVSSTVTMVAAGGGVGGGERLGRFSIVKDVVTEGDQQVPVETEFTVEYRIGDDPEVFTMTLTDGAAATFSERAPAGTTYYVREVSLPEVPGVDSWDPVFTLNGAPLVPDADGWVSLSPGAGEVAALTLTNTAEESPAEFVLLKELSGDAAALEGLTFSVTYSFTDGEAEVEETVVLTPGVPSEPVEAPPGTVVAVSELTPEAVDGFDEWATPTWSGEGVTDAGDGSATFEVEARAVVTATVTNEATKTAPPTSPEVPNTGGGTPDNPTSPENPTSPSLPNTGADQFLITGGVLGLAALAAGLLLVRRAHSVHSAS